MQPLFVFCADLQARETAYKSVRELRGDDLFALQQVVQVANKLKVPLILGGDQVDTPAISDEHVILLRGLLSLLKRVYFVNGNHEKGFQRFTLEGGPAQVAINLETGWDGPIMLGKHTIVGYNWRTRRQWEEDIAAGLIKPADICILHGFADQAVETIRAVDDKPLCDFDLNWFAGKYKLVLMGDIHKHWVDVRGGTTFVYPGSMWMHRLGEDEKKYYIIVFDNLSFKVCELKCRPFKQASIDSVKDLEEVTKWVDEVTKAAEADPDKTMMSYMGKKLPRLHLTITANDHNIRTKIDLLKQKAFIFEKLEYAMEQDIANKQQTSAEKLDLQTAMYKILDIKSDKDKKVASLIIDSLGSDANATLDKLKTVLGVK